MMWAKWGLLWVCLAGVCIGLPSSSSPKLSPYLDNFEGLHYDTESVHQNHVRHKRSIPGDPVDSEPVRLDFVSHGRRFQLELTRDHSVFHNDLHVVDGSGGSIDADTSHIYHGKIKDDPFGQVFGSIRDGVFDGQIHTTRGGTFYVERISKYLTSSPEAVKQLRENHSNKTVHSVIYHERHINKQPFQENKDAGSLPPTPLGCGVGASESVRRWMDDIQNSAQEDEPEQEQKERDSDQNSQNLLEEEVAAFKYTQEANSDKDENNNLNPKPRVKRALENPNKKKSCSLYIQTDPLFWRHIREQESDDAKTEEEILSLIAQHVKAVNRIYSDTPFDGRYKHNGYQFEVQRIKIHNDSLCASGGKVNVDQDQFCVPNVDVSNFLNLHSKSNHEEFCLAYVFTYRDFTGGTLGLAWVASASGASGGICETYKRYTENINGVHHTAKRSLNTGRKPNCFTESDGAFCGNKIVEEGEECDCGFDEHECQEQCCFPRKSNALTDEENKRNRCKRKPGVECSPSEGPCCNRQCRFVDLFERVQCAHEQDCTEPAVCSGRQAQCPQPRAKADNVTECNEGTQVCQAGECKSSICLKFGLESCFLASDQVKDKRQLCELACMEPGNGTCMSTSQLVSLGMIQDLRDGLSLRPGSPCDNFQGYCDVFLKCRKVDAEGPLVRLKNLLFNQETLTTIAEWVTQNWWLVLLASVGIVIFIALCIRCFAIHTPSSNPNMPKNLHFTETLRRPIRAVRQQGVYVGSWVIQNGQAVPAEVAEQAVAKSYRQAHQGAPPPYPGRGNGGGNQGRGGGGGQQHRSNGGNNSGPGHGYGQGRGHYNRSRNSYVDESAGSGGGQNNSRGGQRSRSGNRSSRIEMAPMR